MSNQKYNARLLVISSFLILGFILLFPALLLSYLNLVQFIFTLFLILGGLYLLNYNFYLLRHVKELEKDYLRVEERYFHYKRLARTNALVEVERIDVADTFTYFPKLAEYRSKRSRTQRELNLRIHEEAKKIIENEKKKDINKNKIYVLGETYFQESSHNDFYTNQEYRRIRAKAYIYATYANIV